MQGSIRNPVSLGHMASRQRWPYEIHAVYLLPYSGPCRSPPSHRVGLTLQPAFIIDGDASHLNSRPDPPLCLLDHVPDLVRQVLFLPRRDVDIGALRVGMRIELRWLRRVVSKR